MTAAHDAVKERARHVVAVLGKWSQVSGYWLAENSGVAIDQIPQIITDLRARGEWPEGLRVVGEEQR